MSGTGPPLLGTCRNSPEKKTSRFNLFNRKSPDEENLQEQIYRITKIELKKLPDRSESICRKCSQALPKIEKANEALRSWDAGPVNDENSVQGFDYQVYCSFFLLSMLIFMIL